MVAKARLAELAKLAPSRTVETNTPPAAQGVSATSSISRGPLPSHRCRPHKEAIAGRLARGRAAKAGSNGLNDR
jgi:hypothetical protein